MTEWVQLCTRKVQAEEMNHRRACSTGVANQFEQVTDSKMQFSHSLSLVLQVGIKRSDQKGHPITTAPWPNMTLKYTYSVCTKMQGMRK